MDAPSVEKTPSPPSKDSAITLREIGKRNWRDIVDLTITESQAPLLSSNARSLCESHYSADAWVRGIYADDTPVGFLMMSIAPEVEWYAVWRFMIDQRYQAMGFGRKAIQLAIAYVKDNYPEADMIRAMSAGPEGKKGVSAKDSPYRFYTRLGWKEISEDGEGGEVVLGLDL
ncbi:hypothetical protein BG011_005453 [Mortierella polycephala]|uniref:N-acetyltransferase domain-containing protein n=1 Tax=Mortierella polycephala TaxID=41804 RepID=A0A9P6PVG7_9FUNG|nr:hypothetical protein BG011_005453 [Mortierella polycephala]